MTSNGPAPAPPRREAGRAVILALVALVMVSVLIAVVSSGDGDDPADVGDTAPVGEGLSEDCARLHTGHNAMRWDSTMADDMVALDCAFPYEPFMTSLEGGEEDPAFDAAPFAPHRYDELSILIADTGLGLCTVGLLPDPPGDGFSFGFRYAAAPPGCPELTSSVDLVAREYVTRAMRDAAANDAAGSLVLGRWTIQLEPEDGDGARELHAALVAAGAVDVPSP